MDRLSSGGDAAASVFLFPTPEEAADAVAKRLVAHVSAKPGIVLGLATGQTPRRVYARLAEARRRDDVSFASAKTFNLDEYCGLSAEHPDSYAAYMRRELFRHTDFSARNINLIDGAAIDGEAEADRYAALLAATRVDVQLLGLGTNGHIGFNEPGSSPDARVRIVDLSPETLRANQPTLIELYRVPERAITMGIADILDAREIIVLANGPAKADAVRRCLQGEETEECPGSFLARHPNVLWFLNQDAAAQL